MEGPHAPEPGDSGGGLGASVWSGWRRQEQQGRPDADEGTARRRGTTTVKPGLGGQWLRVSRNPQRKGIWTSSSPPAGSLLLPHAPRLCQGAPVHLSPPRCPIMVTVTFYLATSTHAPSSHDCVAQWIRKAWKDALGPARREEGQGGRGGWRKESVCGGLAGLGGPETPMGPGAVLSEWWRKLGSRVASRKGAQRGPPGQGRRV